MTQVSLFPSRTNLKLQNFSVTLKMNKKVIMNLDFTKASGSDCIPVVALKNCELELSYILAELLIKFLKESCFPDCWKVLSVVPVFKNVGKRSTAGNYYPVSLLFVISNRPWHDTRVIATPTLSPTQINEKETWAGDKKLVKLHGLISPTPNAK